jgi:hypothetical protein
MHDFVKAWKRMRGIASDPGSTEVELLEATLAERDRENPGWEVDARRSECLAALRRGIEPELLREIYGDELTDQAIAAARGVVVGAAAQAAAAEAANAPIDTRVLEPVLEAVAKLDARMTEIAAKTQELTETVRGLVSLIEQPEDQPNSEQPGEEIVAEAVADVDPVFLTKVHELELSVRSAAVLERANIVYIGDLVQLTETEFLRLRNSGRKSLNEINEVLAQMGLHLGMELPDWSDKVGELAGRVEEP